MRTDYTAKQAYQTAYNNTDSLAALISPSDVLDGAKHWRDISDERIERECVESSGHFNLYGNEPYGSAIHDRATTLLLESLTRITHRDICADLRNKYGERELVASGIWLGDMDKWAAMEHIQMLEPFGRYTHERDTLRAMWDECKDEAFETVREGYIDGMNPRAESRYE